MKTVYREKRYYCGEYLDVYIYPTYRQGRSRGKRSKPTSAAQAKLNQRHREEKLVRLLHANFTPDDLEIHLTYQQQPESPEEAQRLLRNYIRRVQRARKKQGLPPLKYIAVTEKGSKNGRYHHHVTLSGGMDRDELEKLWGLGYANSRRLQFTESGLAGLGHYIVKSPLYARAWNASKNLIDPEPKTRDGRISGKRAEELARDTTNNAEYEKLYPGYFLADAGAWHNDVNGGKYNAVWCMNKATFFSDFFPLMNKSKNNVIEFANGKYYIMGAEVYFTGSLAAHEAYLGDFSYIIGNYSQDITVVRSEHSGLATNSIDYLGACVFDSKPVAGFGAFVHLAKAAA